MKKSFIISDKTLGLFLEELTNYGYKYECKKRRSDYTMVTVFFMDGAFQEVNRLFQLTRLTK